MVAFESAVTMATRCMNMCNKVSFLQRALAQLMKKAFKTAPTSERTAAPGADELARASRDGGALRVALGNVNALDAQRLRELRPLGARLRRALVTEPSDRGRGGRCTHLDL